ncbi:alpha/beta hydrolase [Mucilaginibacter phyllosphaerae]
MKALRYILIALLSILLMVMIGGLAYEQISKIQAHRKYAQNETFVDVGGYKLHYKYTDGAAPTVVFEAGLDLGGDLCWYKVQPQVAKFASTFTYDRAGIFMSQSGGKPKNGYEMAKDLHTLLQKTGHKAPYILVGHSMAGIILRSFVKHYPNEVAGVVFVDASHPMQIKRFSKYPQLSISGPPLWLVRLMSDFGIARIFYHEDYPGTKPTDSVNIINRAYLSEAAPAMIQELEAFSPMADSAANMPKFGHIPLIVLTGTSPKRETEFSDAKTGKEFMKIWMELQQDHLKLSTNSQQMLSPKSGHYIQLDDPQLVINAVHKLVAMNRKDSVVNRN